MRHLTPVPLALCVVLLGLFVAAETPAQDGSGSISGKVLQNVEDAHGVDVALVNGDGIRLDLVAPDGSTVTTLSANGDYSFPGLAPGEYQLVAHAPDGKVAESAIPVASGVETRAHVAIVARKEAGVFIYFAAMGVQQGVTHNPDVNVDGFVDTADVDAVKAGIGTAADRSRLDVDRDGDIDEADVAQVLAGFGKAIVNIGTKYQAQVTPGGSVAVIGDGLAHVRSESGSSTGLVEWALAQPPTAAAERSGGRRQLRTELTPAPAIDTSRVRFTITEDVGVASSEEAGLFGFSHDPGDPTRLVVELATGRVKSGRIGLTLSGGIFAKPVNIAGDVGDGIIAFAPGGFALYHVVGVQGTLPEDFPGFAGEAFVMGKCEPAKADKRCQTRRATANDTCKWPAPFGGTARCLGFGDEVCRTENADCVLSGSCNKCKTECTLTGGGVLCGCWCLP